MIDFVIEKGGIAYAEKVMHDYKNKALTILKEFPESPSRNSLELLVNYSIERKK